MPSIVYNKSHEPFNWYLIREVLRHLLLYTSIISLSGLNEIDHFWLWFHIMEINPIDLIYFLKF